MIALECSEIAKAFDGRDVLQDVNVSVRPGQIVGLSGENGSGKTTLINIVSGVVHPDRGRCKIFCNDVGALSFKEISRLGVVRTFQSNRVVGSLTVDQHFRFALQDSSEHGWASLFAGSSAEGAHAVAARALVERAELLAWADQKVSALSFGQRRVISVVSALAAKPRLLVLDEPFAGLHLAMIDLIRSLVREAAADGVGVLLVDHNVDLLQDFADAHWVLQQGCLNRFAPSTNVLRS